MDSHLYLVLLSFIPNANSQELVPQQLPDGTRHNNPKHEADDQVSKIRNKSGGRWHCI